MGGHDFLDYMSFKMTCIMIAYVLGRSCFVLGNVLWEVMYWWSACLQDGISYNMLCFTESHV